MPAPNEATILAALGKVIDPASGRDIVPDGRVQGLVVRDSNVGFAIEIDPARAAESESLRKAAEDAVFAFRFPIDSLV